ncbi:MAG: ACT domain-containing protein [Acidobacteria bacterium]|nr:ACT domain-containing protein [Acidobacteriota bacterium]
MAQSVCKVEVFTAEIANKVGAGAKALAALKEGGVNLVAFWGYPLGAKAKKAAIEIVPETAAGFKKIAKKAGLEVEKSTGFIVEADDQPGALAGILGALAAADINVSAVKSMQTGAGKFKAGIFVAPEDVRKAGKILGA